MKESEWNVLFCYQHKPHKHDNAQNKPSLSMKKDSNFFIAFFLTLSLKPSSDFFLKATLFLSKILKINFIS